MKRLLTIAILILFCFSLTSCELFDAIKAAKYSITGEVIEREGDFSIGDKDGICSYKGNEYILVEEINGECRIGIPKDYIALGRTSNFPIFPDTHYYTSPDENPKFVCGYIGGLMGTFVYLREDIYNNGIIYVLEDSSYEFEFSSVFFKTNKVNYGDHVADKKYTDYKRVNFYIKDIPEIEAEKEIYLIGNTWYCIEKGEAYQLSDEFSQELMKEKQ